MKRVAIILICMGTMLLGKFFCGFYFGLFGAHADDTIMFMAGYTYTVTLLYLFPQLFNQGGTK